MKHPSVDAELHWLGLELRDGDLLRAVVKVTGARYARVLVTVTLDGDVVDLQADDYAGAGTTGDEALDQVVQDYVLARLSIARDAWTYGQAMHRRRVAQAPSRRR